MTFFKVKFGLSGGFGGADECEILDCENLEEAENSAHLLALEYASQYEGMYGLPNFDEIMEEEGCSEEEATEIYYERLEDWLDYEAEEYHGETE
ncbi:hypothetical protein KAU33_09175 [Candidatus Dependentiae bacterium]|nr:hypothetical protein [Candidatus Dependentiae bacterium]